MDGDYPRTRLDLLARINGAMAELDGTIAPLSDARLAAPGPGGDWSIADHLYHLGAWRRKVIAQMQGGDIPAALGIERALWDDDEIDAINAAIHQQGAALTASEALASFRDAHRVLLTALADFPEADFGRPGYPDQPDGGPMVAYIAGNSYEHDAEHLGYIRALLTGD